MLPAIKRRVGDFLLSAFDISAGLGMLSGAVVVAFFGKLLLAIVLAAVSLGFFLRLASRRGTSVPRQIPLPIGYQLAAAVLACIEVAVVIEAANLPVRFYQDGFEPYHLVLVLLALVVVFVVNLRLVRALRKKEHASAP